VEESVGKSIEREIFFAECLVDWLTPEQIRQGAYLLLLGDKLRELAYTDGLEIPRRQIFSVERSAALFKKQSRKGTGVKLFRGELIPHLQSLLSGAREFLVLRLDVEGSYLSQLDPAMTPVFLLCWRNPETVVATYSTVGRDTEMLWEGVKSLAISLWLAPELTRRVLAALLEQYESYEEPINMALRDFFWIRSMLEHAFIASGVMGVAKEQAVSEWFVHADLLWASVSRWRRKPLRLRMLEESVALAVANDPAKREIILHSPPSLGIEIDRLNRVVYNGVQSWSQMCFYARLQVLPEAIDCREWLARLLQKFLTEPLTFVRKDGTRDVRVDGEKPLSPDTAIYSRADLYDKFNPRHLVQYQMSQKLIRIWRRSVEARRKEQMAREVLVRSGELTDSGKALVKLFARKYPDETTNEIVTRLPAQMRKVPEGTLRALVAVGRRK
jgi:hypothetical protein